MDGQNWLSTVLDTNPPLPLETMENAQGLITLQTLYRKPLSRSSSNQQLHDVIWPGQMAEKPREWVFLSNGKQLRIRVPKRDTVLILAIPIASHASTLSSGRSRVETPISTSPKLRSQSPVMGFSSSGRREQADQYAYWGHS
ncbi:hypothetical protein U1Q18_010199 [Sarracenia purpurea var. burkii]